MRRFGRITKEMRPSHREDILTHALVYYGMRTKKNLANLMLTRWERAHHTKAVAEESFSNLMPGIDWVVAEGAVKLWLSEERNACDHKPAEYREHWQYRYTETLQLYESLRKQLACGDASDPSEVTKLDEILKDMEKKFNLQYRRLTSDQEFTYYKSLLEQNRRWQLLSGVWAASRRRKFLLKLKAKYADGQKIAKSFHSKFPKSSEDTLKGV